MTRTTAIRAANRIDDQEEEEDSNEFEAMAGYKQAAGLQEPRICLEKYTTQWHG